MAGSRRGRSLDLRVDSRPGEVLVAPRGDVDRLSAPALRHALWASASAEPGAVVVDLSDVEFMDLGGVDAVIEVAEALSCVGGAVTVRSAPPLVGLMFELTGARDGLVVEAVGGPDRAPGAP